MKEKIKLLSDLNSALEDTELFSALEARSNGALIASILKKGIESEIESIFANASDNTAQQAIVSSLLENLIKAESLAKKTSALLETQSTARQAPPQQSVQIRDTSIPAVESTVTQLTPAPAKAPAGNLQNVGGRSFVNF